MDEQKTMSKTEKIIWAIVDGLSTVGVVITSLGVIEGLNTPAWIATVGAVSLNVARVLQMKYFPNLLVKK